MEGRTPKQLDFFKPLGVHAEKTTKDVSARRANAAADAKDQAGPKASRIDFKGLYGRPKPDAARAKPQSHTRRE